MNEKVEIISFEKIYRENFKELNLEWLNKYFSVEPIDLKILSEPEAIIAAGGEIIFAKINDEIVGTGALIKLDEKTVELSKMAVTPKAQGKKIGYLLADSLIKKARNLGFSKIVLESSTKLIPALSLYQKLGFTEVKNFESDKYLRSDIKMELEL